MNKHIVVTGSGGILGSAILDKLTNHSQNKIYAISSQVEKLQGKYKDFDNVYVHSSVADISSDTIDIAIHCAFPRSNVGKELATAFDFTERVMTRLANKGIKTFINISSQSVYTQFGEEIQTEKSAVEPSNLYGMTKYALEHLVRLKAHELHLNYTNVRLGSLASATFDQRMINRFYERIVNREPIKVDSGNPMVSYLHVEDAADALITLTEAILNGKSVSTIYNLANNDWHYIKDLVEKCLKYAEKLGLEKTDMFISEKISEYNNVVNSDLFYRDFQWSPTYTMNELIKVIFDNKNSITK